MGVPAFFRWLQQKFGKIIVDVIDPTLKKDANGVELPQNNADPNPNGIEFDNFYLDMNNIVHNCTHPEDKDAPESEDAMLLAVSEGIDKLFSIVRPRKLLMMAIDGVAPRAKMNQQRSRRFRSAQDAAEKRAIAEKVLERVREEGGPEPPETKPIWDSNAITPGTPFMDKVAKWLHFWVAEKISTDPGWRNIKVIISDSNVPGEGEHKIMEYIRAQRSQPGYDPNLKHAIYGLDADLIMLSLATHEAHFSILRDVITNNATNCFICGKPGHLAINCTDLSSSKASTQVLAAADSQTHQEGDQFSKTPRKKPYQFLHIFVLREYLRTQLEVENLPFEFDLERAIDDFVFLCFFVGNDFLPHLPTLDIRENAIFRLIDMWKRLLPTTGWLTEHGTVFFDRVSIILADLANVEDDILKERNAKEKSRKERQKRQNEQQREQTLAQNPNYRRSNSNYNNNNNRDNRDNRDNRGDNRDNFRAGGKRFASEAEINDESNSKRFRETLVPLGQPKPNMTPSLIAQPPQSTPAQPQPEPKTENIVAEVVKNENDNTTLEIKPESTINSAPSSTTATTQAAEPPTSQPQETQSQENILTRQSSVLTDSSRTTNPDDDEPEDNVRLGEEGWKSRYYQNKFHVELEDRDNLNKIRDAYLAGLQWVLRYYYVGCPSWSWFYPYHFAPFSSELCSNPKFSIEFEKGTPFKPLTQLMAVFPAASRAHIPVAYHSLMLDPKSPIIDFYPTNFEIDMNGKKMAWQGIALLPFIDQDRLLEALEPLHKNLSEEEKRRNEVNSDIICFSSSSPMFKQLEDFAGTKGSAYSNSLKYNAQNNNNKATNVVAAENDKNSENVKSESDSVPIVNTNHDEIKSESSTTTTTTSIEMDSTKANSNQEINSKAKDVSMMEENDLKKEIPKTIDLDPSLSDGIRGIVWRYEYAPIPGEALTSPIATAESLTRCHSFSVRFQYPAFEKVIRGILVGAKVRKFDAWELGIGQSSGRPLFQNAAAFRMVNHYVGDSNQYKNSSHHHPLIMHHVENQQRREYNPYRRPGDNAQHSGQLIEDRRMGGGNNNRYNNNNGYQNNNHHQNQHYNNNNRQQPYQNQQYNNNNHNNYNNNRPFQPHPHHNPPPPPPNRNQQQQPWRGPQIGVPGAIPPPIPPNQQQQWRGPQLPQQQQPYQQQQGGYRPPQPPNQYQQQQGGYRPPQPPNQPMPFVPPPSIVSGIVPQAGYPPVLAAGQYPQQQQGFAQNPAGVMPNVLGMNVVALQQQQQQPLLQTNPYSQQQQPQQQQTGTDFQSYMQRLHAQKQQQQQPMVAPQQQQSPQQPIMSFEQFQKQQAVVPQIPQAQPNQLLGIMALTQQLQAQAQQQQQQVFPQQPQPQQFYQPQQPVVPAAAAAPNPLQQLKLLFPNLTEDQLRNMQQNLMKAQRQ